jgi:hypothetical protein
MIFNQIGEPGQVQWWKRYRWKILGLAGFVGVAATGAVIVRTERHRRAYTPEEIRERLHARLAEADADHPEAASGISS